MEDKKRIQSKARMRKMRERNKSVTNPQSVTSPSEGITGPMVTRRLAVKLVGPVWRDRIERISESLGSLASEVRLDGITMPTWRMLLDTVSIS